MVYTAERFKIVSQAMGGMKPNTPSVTLASHQLYTIYSNHIQSQQESIKLLAERERKREKERGRSSVLKPKPRLPNALPNEGAPNREPESAKRGSRQFLNTPTLRCSSIQSLALSFVQTKSFLHYLVVRIKQWQMCANYYLMTK